MNNSSFILAINAIYAINIIASLPLLCSGTVEQQCCRQRRLSEDDAYAGIIIDPKEILNDDTRRIITKKLQQYSSTEFHYESSSAVNNSNINSSVEPSEAEKVANQTKCSNIRVAIVDDTAFRFYNDHDYDFGIDLLQHDNDNGSSNNNYSAVMMAEYVAKRLHNRLWDVKSNKEEGEEAKRIKTEEGTNKRGMTTLLDSYNDANILIYLDIRDRVVFITVDNNNPNLRRILTDKRIDRIIRNEMKPYFKNDDYGNGLIKGMEQIIDLLENNNGEEEDEQYVFFDFEGFLWIILVILHCHYNLRLKQRKRQQQRVHAKNASELSTQDIIHDEELRKTHAETTNCPICLEDFQSCCIGSDSKPIKILRCGHVFDESCFLEWITYGHGGDITKCPICRSEVGGPNTNNNDSDSNNGDDSGTLVGNREGYVSRWSFTFNRTSSHSPLMTRRSSSHLTNTSSNDSYNDDDDAITTSSSSSADSYYAFGGDDDGDTNTTSVGGRGGRF
ncbi:hypothetical protein FRACYDRAFT_238415 [Fragilariopsis cylindrus CCMP1102]|uniref:RING-type domain-containing protein n=1 Tax=Fragilariopsis cylindrus CCMP1102 TaxID=635003 RepID=A0A1E7FIM5_9STRA|nr:hypothetical protein FRACYDRAFT_238415 [Fragilariopsis cylindrus CCMP1102]|eukprot:OEU17984.1 hypothetical protein FRACYDRAFT_238415 [Fragilariopsis cylindrus CCMP1102]